MIKKETIKVQLVDNDFIWLEEIKTVLEESGFNNIRTYVDGNDAIRGIGEYKPDIVVVDQNAQNKDGLMIIQYIKDNGLKIDVILTTRYASETLLWKADMLNVQYIIIKPVEEEVIVARINDILEMKAVTISSAVLEQDNEDDLEEIVEEIVDPLMIIDEIGLESNIGRILMGFEIKAHLKGYKYLKTAILMTIMNEHITSAMTRELYPQIARRFNTSYTSVERDMRHAIETAWANTPLSHKKAFFGAQYIKSHADKKPANSLFINTLAEKVRHNLKGQISLLSM